MSLNRCLIESLRRGGGPTGDDAVGINDRADAICGFVLFATGVTTQHLACSMTSNNLALGRTIDHVSLSHVQNQADITTSPVPSTILQRQSHQQTDTGRCSKRRAGRPHTDTK